MKSFLCTLLPLLLCSCATTIYDGNGGKLAVIRSDATNLSLVSNNVSFSAATLNNSTPTAAVGSMVKAGLGAWSVVSALRYAPNTINAFTGNHPVPVKP